MFLIHVHDNLLNEHSVLSFASRTQPWHTAPIMTSGKYHSFFPFFFSFYLNLVLVVQHLRAYIRLFLSRYALYKNTKYKQGKSHSGRCEKQFSIPALCSSPPCPHQCYAIRHWCSSVLYKATFSFTPLRVLGVSAKGTLPHLSQTSRSPQIPTKLRSSCSSMVCYWLGFTFCYLLM